MVIEKNEPFTGSGFTCTLPEYKIYQGMLLTNIKRGRKGEFNLREI